MRLLISKQSRLVPATVGFLLLFIAVSAAVPTFSKSAEILSSELVKLETRPGVTQKFILIKPENPMASVILFAGGNGKLKLGSAFGKPTVSNLSKNFLVRTREDFAKHGLNVAVVDAPSDMAGKKRGMVTFSKETKKVFRMSDEHVQDIKAVVNYLQTQGNIPVWLVGTSAGTVSATNGAIHIKEGIYGLVLTSTLTRFGKKFPMYSSHPKGVLDMELLKITFPTLIVSHKEDKCRLTPASDAPELKAALVSSPKVEVMYFTGGRRPKSKPCQALSAHGFYGIEDQVVTAIADFIKSNSK
jgi:hypothetical protein